VPNRALSKPESTVFIGLGCLALDGWFFRRVF
jgi:hypothetical protein